jgi:hypothetical protein
MRIAFQRFPAHVSAYSVIERDDGVVYHLREFSRSGSGLPHDLRHLVVQRELGIADGIWGGIAAGIVYPGMEHVRGRRPPAAADHSDELKRTQRDRVMRAELLASLVEAVAVLADPSSQQIERLAQAKGVALPPAAALAAAARALQVEAARWARLRPGEELVYEWRQVRPGATRGLRPVPRPREAADRRDPRPSGRRGPR